MHENLEVSTEGHSHTLSAPDQGERRSHTKAIAFLRTKQLHNSKHRLMTTEISVISIGEQ